VLANDTKNNDEEAGRRAAVLSMPRSAPAQQRKIADGIFKPTLESLKQFSAPDWFRDAKFGMRAHWSRAMRSQQGDWYARLI